jgi:hypothetical protein
LITFPVTAVPVPEPALTGADAAADPAELPVPDEEVPPEPPVPPEPDTTAAALEPM